MPIHFGGLTIDEWNGVLHASQELPETIAGKSLDSSPGSSQRAEEEENLKSAENLTWSQRLQAWKKSPKVHRGTQFPSWSNKCEKAAFHAPNVSEDGRLFVEKDGSASEKSSPISILVDKSSAVPEPSSAAKLPSVSTKQSSLVNGHAGDKESESSSGSTLKPPKNAWLQDRDRTGSVKGAPQANGVRSSPKEVNNIPKENGPVKTIPGMQVETSGEVQGSYERNFPDALTNGCASQKRTNIYAATDFDYKEHFDLLRGVLQNYPIASGNPILPVGLVNPSSTCYINAIVQSLFSCSPFTRTLVSKSWRYDSTLLNKFRLFYLRVALHRKEEKGREWPSPLVPALFYNVFPSTNANSANTKSFSQEDAQEFFAYVVNEAHEQILKTAKHEPKKTQINGTKSVLDWSVVGVGGRKITERQFIDDEHHKKTVISELFGGLTLSEIIYPGKDRSAGETRSKRFERFYSLGLEVGNGTASIVDGLKKYFKEEKLDNGVIKALDIAIWPQILVIQLMRFRYTKETGEVEKVNQLCEYPEYLAVEDSARPSIRGRGRRREQHKYRLVGVVTHHGKDIASGHYTCDVWRDAKVKNEISADDKPLVRTNSRSRRVYKGGALDPWFEERSAWYNCDDSKMTEVSLEEVLNRQAYLLFYQRQNKEEE